MAEFLSQEEVDELLDIFEDDVTSYVVRDVETGNLEISNTKYSAAKTLICSLDDIKEMRSLIKEIESEHLEWLI